MVKYLAYYEKDFYEFKTFKELDFFKCNKKNLRYKKITSKKAEEEFKRDCIENPDRTSKIYVVITKDGRAESLDKWSEVQEYIKKGCKSYKSFKKREDAQAWINNNAHSVFLDSNIVCEVKNGEIDLLRENSLVKKIPLQDKSFEAELKGILEAIKECIEMKEEQVLVKCKCLGAKNWANGVWTPKKPYSKKYKEQIEKYRKDINIDFVCIEDK